jgi:2-haloacid dehalogenase
MRHVIVFDVNETLLDLRALDQHFAQWFGDPSVRREWFGQLLQSALVTTVTNAYATFGDIGMAALDMVGARRGVAITEDLRQAIRDGMVHLPAHPEVRESLEQLRDAGFRLAALTNSIAQVAEAQLSNAGIRDLFIEVLSADDAGRLKPAPEPYRLAAERLGVDVAGMRLVAAHAWDVAGALRAGCAAAFVARPGMVLDPLVPAPDIIGADLREVAAQIIQTDI